MSVTGVDDFFVSIFDLINKLLFQRQFINGMPVYYLTKSSIFF
ncbi:hypothetical protein Mpsy_0612 [Methanolobus psychrophilus R15]|nr:hypothetical protein Mpsy_0612 [Methanolobus psychrophilus R15]